MEEWIKYECLKEECGRRFAVCEVPGDELEEPACPECGETNCKGIEVSR